MPTSATNILREAMIAIKVGKVQSVTDGYGFNIKATPYSWMTLIYETKEAAEEGYGYAIKALAKATSATLSEIP